MVKSGEELFTCGLFAVGRVMAKFMGEYNHTVDAKGRVIVPSKFREKLGDSFVVTKGLDHCLAIYDMENWEKLEEKLNALNSLTADSRVLRRMMVGSASEAETDKQGRVLLPSPLRDYAGLDKDVVLIGNIDHVEIWNRASWEAAQDIDADEAAEKLYAAGITL